ncbi:MAG TPA: GerMN domain-containing protein [Dongiaceae bacterium]|nr:GerMN domain-containing protein [Dongiaceae bacterium]
MTRRTIRRTMLVTVVLGALVVTGWWWSRRPHSREVPAPSAADSARAGVRSVGLYFAAPGGDSLVKEAREVVDSPDVGRRIRVLVSELDRGPRGRGVAALPAGTGVLHCYLDDGGLLTLDLTGAFRQGFRGGTTAEYLAIGSLVRTLGANVPEVKRVLIICVGRPIATLGGHLPLDQPLDVHDWP